MSGNWRNRRGKPRSKSGHRRRVPKKGVCRLTCSSSGRIEDLHRWVLARAANPRCPPCGGPLNRFREVYQLMRTSGHHWVTVDACGPFRVLRMPRAAGRSQSRSRWRRMAIRAARGDWMYRLPPPSLSAAASPSSSRSIAVRSTDCESPDSLRGHRASGGVAGLRVDTGRPGPERASGQREKVDAPTTFGTPLALGPIYPAQESLPPNAPSRRMRGCLFPCGATKQIDC